MCRPIPPVPSIAIHSVDTRALDPKHAESQHLESTKAFTRLQTSNEVKRPPSILRESSYVATLNKLKRSQRCNSVPGLCLVEEETGYSIERQSSISLEEDTFVTCSKRVAFSNSVAVQEFCRFPGEAQRTWYSRKELIMFQQTVEALIKHYERHHFWSRFFKRTHRILHSHPALSMDAEPYPAEDEQDASTAEDHTIQNQIQRVLLVDSRDLSLKLFGRAFQLAFPHSIITTAKHSQDALSLCHKEKNGFDVIVVEERLTLFRNCSDSGSGLLQSLDSKQCQRALLIGVSAHLDTDEPHLRKSGADLCWSKPPPPLNEATVEELFQKLLAKRQLLE